LTIHRNPTIEFNTIFGKIEIRSPYLWGYGEGWKTLVDEMNITHQGRSETVKRALSHFGIEFSLKQRISTNQFSSPGNRVIIFSYIFIALFDNLTPVL